MGARKKAKDAAKDREHSREVLHRFRNRFTFIKQGKEYYKKDDFVSASRCYIAYFQIVADFKSVELKSLGPAQFDQKTELSEMLLISHAFWDLAKIYDRSPKLYKDLVWVLDSFVKFSTGVKYQVLNSGMIRRFIKAKRLHNKDLFDNASKQIHIGTKTCFVATYCFHQNHLITKTFRQHRNWIILSPLGARMVYWYYIWSPLLVNYLKNNPHIGLPLKILVFRPILCLIYFFCCLLDSINGRAKLNPCPVRTQSLVRNRHRNDE